MIDERSSSLNATKTISALQTEITPSTFYDRRGVLTIELPRLRWLVKVHVWHMYDLSGSHDILIMILSYFVKCYRNTSLFKHPIFGILRYIYICCEYDHYLSWCLYWNKLALLKGVDLFAGVCLLCKTSCKICHDLYESGVSPPGRHLALDYPRSRLIGMEIFACKHTQEGRPSWEG